MLGPINAKLCLKDCDADADGCIDKAEFQNYIIKAFADEGAKSSAVTMLSEFEAGCTFLEEAITAMRAEGQ